MDQNQVTMSAVAPVSALEPVGAGLGSSASVAQLSLDPTLTSLENGGAAAVPDMVVTSGVGETNGTDITYQPDQLHSTSTEPTATTGATGANGPAAVATTGVVTYNDLFPALPDSATAGAASAEANGPHSARAGAAAGPVATNSWAQKMRVGSSSITQVFHVPFEERRSDTCRFGEHSSARTCAEIMQKTQTTIECSTGRDQTLTFLVMGKQVNVLKAKRLIMERFQTTGSQEVFIPKVHHRHIMGRGATRLRELEQTTATRIQVPAEGDPGEMVTVSGAKDDIERAIHQLKAISEMQSKQARVMVPVPKKYHPFISGAHNENVNRWTSDNPGVRIDIPPPSVMQDEIAVTGEKEGVLRVEECIKTLASEMQRCCSQLLMQVSKSQHRYVVGARGSGLQDILQRTGVIVDLPPLDSQSDTVTLLGPQEKLSAALSLVYERSNSVVTTQLAAPGWCHRLIIGKKGADIKQLTGDLDKVNIEFDSESNQVKIEGPKEDVAEARGRLERVVAELLNTRTYQQVQVPAKHHKHIIGKAGAVVNRIKTEFGVTISIPHASACTDLIGVEGPKDGVKDACQQLQAIGAKLEAEKERDIIIDSRHHRQIIGPKGDTIGQIRQQFPDVIILLPKSNENSDIVKLRGPKEMVDQCYRHLQKMVKDIEASSYQERVSIYKQHHGFIIGRGGANIRQIREQTGTRIDLPAPSDDSCEVLITGRPAAVQQARHMIEQLQSSVENVVQLAVTVPARYHNSLIGAGGRHIHSVMNECGGVQIKFPPPDAHSDQVILKGPKDDVEKAKQMLVKLSNDKVLHGFTAEVRAKPEYHRFLIGKNGSKIDALRSETSTRISFPVDGDKQSDVIIVEGKKENVLVAKEKLESLIKDLEMTVSETISVPVQHHRHFVARQAEVLRQLRRQFGGVEVSFPRQQLNSDQVVVKGAAECVQAAIARIGQIVQSLERQVTIVVDIEPRHHGSVMGPRGCHVQRVSQQCEVQIKFPERRAAAAAAANNTANTNNIAAGGDGAAAAAAGGGTQSPSGGGGGGAGAIMITGLPEQCETARAELLALVPETRQLSVPYEYHRFIIGKGGDGVRELMTRHDVNIAFPPSDQHSDIVRVSGLKDNVEETRLALLRRVQELDDERADRQLRSFALHMHVPLDYHSKIIGRGGAVISRLRQQHDVQIHFPGRDGGAAAAAAAAAAASAGGDSGGAASCDQITIVGYQKNAEAARDAIQQMIDQLENMVRMEVPIAACVHARIIGTRGKNIRQIMKDFKVEVNFPRPDDADPDLVVVLGANGDDVDSCVDHLQCLEEEFLQDVAERAQTQQLLRPARAADGSVLAAAAGGGGSGGGGGYGGDGGGDGGGGDGVTNGGFVVKGAPWQADGANGGEGGGGGGGGEVAPPTVTSENFPSIGDSTAIGAGGDCVPVVWGPRR